MSATITISNTDHIDPIHYDWGAVKWVISGKVIPGSRQSFGLVHVLPGKTNPEHWHTAAEELVYMLAGVCTVRVGDAVHALRPGQTLHIPAGVKHVVSNEGWEPVVYVASFSAADRGTLFSGDRPGDEIY